MKSTTSDQNYLETILLLQEENGAVRAVDIAEALDFSKPSVSIAMKKLTEKGLVHVEDNIIDLTEKGREIANKIYERHRVLTQILMKAGVDEQTAQEDACRIEHVISEHSFAMLREYFARESGEDIKGTKYNRVEPEIGDCPKGEDCEYVDSTLDKIH